jgi:uncharacterized membrane protein YhfC
MLIFSYILNPLLMVALPVALGLFLARRLRLPWRLFFIGAATFILSQVVHIPLNLGLDRLFDIGVLPKPPEAYQLLASAVLLGLTAGLCEEIARYAVYRWWIKSARTWREGLMFGAGHGGIEAMITGVLAGLGVVNIVVLANTDLSTLPITPEQLKVIEQQMAAALSYPWYFPLLGALERVFAMTFHLAAALMVLQVFRRRNLLWLLAAILWHTTLNAVAVYVLRAVSAAQGEIAGALWAEAALAVLALANLGIILALRGGEPFAPLEAGAPPAEPLPAPRPLTLEPEEPTAESLDKTRYQ